MKKHNIHLDTYWTTSSGQSLSASSSAPSTLGYALIVSSSSLSHEWIIDYGASYHMDNDKVMFSSLNDCNTKNLYFGDDRSLSVVGFGR